MIRNLFLFVNILYIVSIHPVVAACAEAVARTPPVASKVFPNARARIWPFGVPSYSSAVALARICVASYPAIYANAARSGGMHRLFPVLHSDTIVSFVPSCSAMSLTLTPEFFSLSMSIFA